jgi:ADP-heptose:LPS heptosyltransferase
LTYPYNPKLKKILVIQTASIGDVILATPVLEKLHIFFPEAQIDLLVKKGIEGLFAGHPFLNNVLTWNKTHRKKRNFLWLLHDIRRNHYDAVINIQRFTSTGLLTALSGAKIRIGFSKNPLSFFFTNRIKHVIGGNIHETDRNLGLIEKLTDGTGIKPKIYPTAKDIRKIDNYKSDVYYTISPGSLWYTKKFPEDKWVEFVRKIDKDSNVIFLGSKEDNGMCDSIIRKSGHKNSVNMSGHLSFLESAALMEGAKMNFTNDSAPMHLASSVNAPVTVVFCSTIPGFGFGPLSDQSYIVEINGKLPCRPCGLHGLKSCPKKHFKCALNIEADQLTKYL